MIGMTAEPMALPGTVVDAVQAPARPFADDRSAVTAIGALSHAWGEVRRRDMVYGATKRAFDLVAALTLLVILLPVLAVVSLAVCLDTGFPVLYRQQRVGRHGRPFTVVKFRSMRADADPTPHLIFVTSLLREAAGNCAIYKVAADPRITRVGALLRRTSLDELPQLWNVLRGDMSLVGPRPDVPYAVAEYADWMRRRLVVKPGITGLWQVSGRSRVSLHDMYRLDLSYVSEASLLLDLRILIQTVPVVLRRDGAA
jgi:lipopolysaccharide/colanic/teichoic acid biosynthesis glycosyltransferase